jgi:hypothetical protein
VSLTAYTRFRFLWGAVDWESGSGTPYSSAQTANLGTNAVTGVAARRVLVQISRGTTVDPAIMHFDMVKAPAGTPTDAWSTTDYTTAETALDAWWTTTKAKVAGGYSLAQYGWYRCGVGITPPNPAIRVVSRSVAGTGAYGDLPPQVACSITFRTASRRSWGRTYLPLGALGGSTDLSGGRFSNAYCDAIAGAAHTLVGALAAADLYLVVCSETKSALLNVESVEVDNVPDVIRRRRWKTSTYKKILP